MVNIAKLGDSAIKFTFTDNYRYLHNGEIEVPLNSLILVVDESDMVTFKKIDGDPFVSFLISDSNFESKDTLIYFYKTSMVGGTGGSESGITSGDVESMISASLEDYYDIDEVDAALSGKADTSSVYTKGEVDAALSGKADTSAVTEAITAAVSGKQDTLIAGSGITISGNVISAEGGNNVIELTQAEYDALVTGGTVDHNAFYIITDATEINISDYYTSAQTQSAINAAVSGKQDTLIAGDNITISGNVISAVGGGKAVIGGTNISITTGETADTINCTLPMSVGTGLKSVQFSNAKAKGQCSIAIGDNTKNSSLQTEANGLTSFSCGLKTIANKKYSAAFGDRITTNNDDEFGCGSFNNSVSASTTFGDSGNTLFSVGNGTSINTKHNAFEIRQNGDIYITSGGTDIKLQDNLGGGSITIDPSLDSGSTNAVANSAITNALDSKIQNFRTNSNSQTTIRLAITKNGWSYSDKDLLNLYNGLKTIGASGLTIDLNGNQEFKTYSAATDARISEDEEVTAAALNALNDELSAKQDTLVAGDNITISGNVISADGGGKAVSGGTNISITTGETADTINCTLPIVFCGTTSTTKYLSFDNKSNTIDDHSYNTNVFGSSNTIYGGSNTNQFNCNNVFGGNNTINLTSNTTYTNGYCAIFGYGNSLIGKDLSHSYAFGKSNVGNNSYEFISGYMNIANNKYESTLGICNNSVSASTTFGNSGNTLFSVGNGYNNSNRHNTFEIRQNGEIYIADTNDTSTSNFYEKPMIKLQDALGGGGGVSESAFTSYSAATDARLSEDEEVTAAALNALNDRVDAIDITVDDALDATSENPVQNKVIYAVIGDIESLLSNI